MVGSKGEVAFDALGLNPQLFINDILNIVDDVMDAAFDFYQKKSVKILGSGGDGCSMMSEDVAQGISNLRCLVEAALDKQMSIWEKYCLSHCFSVPETFVLPKNKASSWNCSIQPELPDSQLDLQLDTVRMKLAAALEKNAELQRDIHSLEKHNRYGASIVETVQLLEQNSVPQTFKDIEEATSMLQKQNQETMVNMKDDTENHGLIKISMLKEEMRREDKALLAGPSQVAYWNGGLSPAWEAGPSSSPNPAGESPSPANLVPAWACRAFWTRLDVAEGCLGIYEGESLGPAMAS